MLRLLAMHLHVRVRCPLVHALHVDHDDQISVLTGGTITVAQFCRSSSTPWQMAGSGLTQSQVRTRLPLKHVPHVVHDDQIAVGTGTVVGTVVGTAHLTES